MDNFSDLKNFDQFIHILNMRSGLQRHLGLRCRHTLFHHLLESALMSFLTKYSVQKRIVVGLAALTITVGLAGCSNDAEANSEDSTDTTDVETEYIPASADGPAQNVPEPNLPAVATENTEEGAEATLQYFWEAIDYVRLTGDSTHVDRVSRNSCDFCADLMDGWKEAYAGDSWADLKGSVDVEISETRLDSDDQQQENMTSISFVLTEPAVDFYEEGQLLEDESFDTESTADWWVELTYDGTAQRWAIEWIGLEEHLPEARS